MWNPVKAFIDNLKNVLLEMQAGDEEIGDIEICMFLDEIENLISFPETAVINDAFDYVGAGCFKVCFDSYFANWIVKFYYCEEETLNEKDVLALAEKAGFGDMFAKSYYVTLPCAIEGYCKEGYDESDKRKYNGFMLQRRAEIVSDIWEGEEEDEDERYNSDLDMNLLNYIDARSEWILACKEEYGDERLWDFYEFLMQYSITDLHDGNVGFSNGKPVIVDWDSYSYSEEDTKSMEGEEEILGV